MINHWGMLVICWLLQYAIPLMLLSAAPLPFVVSQSLLDVSGLQVWKAALSGLLRLLLLINWFCWSGRAPFLPLEWGSGPVSPGLKLEQDPTRFPVWYPGLPGFLVCWLLLGYSWVCYPPSSAILGNDVWSDPTVRSDSSLSDFYSKWSCRVQCFWEMDSCAGSDWPDRSCNMLLLGAASPGWVLLLWALTPAAARSRYVHHLSKLLC